MFETLSLPSLDIVVLITRAVVLFGAFCVFALAFIRWRNADARSNAQLAQQLERTFAEVRSLHESIAVMGARLEALSEKSETTRLPAPSTSASPRGYDIAARLAKNGADAEGLIANCGLTRHEAELMVRLHGNKQATDFTATGSTRVPRLEPAAPAPAPRPRPAPEPRNTATSRTAEVPVLKVAAPETRAAASSAAGGRRRGGLVSMVG